MVGVGTWYLSFNKATAILGVIYAAVLFYYYRRLKVVWRREAERSQRGLVMFTVLFLMSLGSFAYVYYIYKKKRFLERKAADLIQKEKNKPLHLLERRAETSRFGKFVKVFTGGLLSFMALHRIIRKT